MTARPVLIASGLTFIAVAVVVWLILFPVGPRVAYHRFADPGRSDSWIPFRLTDTVVVIGAVGGAAAPVSLDGARAICGAGDCKPALVAVAAPADDEARLLAIQPVSRGLASTHIAPTYLANSLRLKTLAIEVVDHRQELVSTLGAIVVGGRSLMGGGPVSARSAGGAAAAIPLNLPLMLELASLKPVGVWRKLPDSGGWEAMAVFLDADPKTAGFIPLETLRGIHGAVVSSTCRPLRVELRLVGQAHLSFTVRVADPDWLTPSPLPVKGAILFQPLCGADVQAEKSVTVAADALAQNFFTQVQAVRAAVRAPN